MLTKAAAACLALAATTASAQWEVLYDSQGMEHWETGEVGLGDTDYPIIWSAETSHGATARIVSSATDPTLGERSLRLDIAPEADSEVEVHIYDLSKWKEWSPPGTRGIRFRFDVRRTRAEWMDRFIWTIHSWGDWGWKGGRQDTSGAGEGSTTYLLRHDLETPTLTDEWVTVEHTFDLWQKRSYGRYGEFEAERDMGGCCYRGDLQGLRFLTVSPWFGPFDSETIWLDNLVIETVPPCFADCDRNLELDLFDFLCFQNQFAAGNPTADCDQDGRLTYSDFLCFQNAFAGDCDI